jgi:uncharacterized protein (DUF1330 family)
MAAYVIVYSKVRNPERIKEYSTSDGKPILAGGTIEVEEDDWMPSRLMVLKLECDGGRLIQLAGISGNPADPPRIANSGYR